MGRSLSQQLDRLESQRRQLLSSVAHLDDGALNWPPGEGRWSIAQLLAHLVEAERRTLAYVQTKMKYPDSLVESGLSGWVRSTLLVVALRQPFRIKAPPGAGEVPEHGDLETLEAEWQGLRERWSALIESFPPELRTKAIFRHPVMGRMSLGQAFRFLEVHLARHAGQIARIVASLPERPAIG